MLNNDDHVIEGCVWGQKSVLKCRTASHNFTNWSVLEIYETHHRWKIFCESLFDSLRRVSQFLGFFVFFYSVVGFLGILWGTLVDGYTCSVSYVESLLLEDSYP